MTRCRIRQKWKEKQDLIPFLLFSCQFPFLVLHVRSIAGGLILSWKWLQNCIALLKSWLLYCVAKAPSQEKLLVSLWHNRFKLSCLMRSEDKKSILVTSKRDFKTFPSGSKRESDSRAKCLSMMKKNVIQNRLSRERKHIDQVRHAISWRWNHEKIRRSYINNNVTSIEGTVREAQVSLCHTSIHSWWRHECNWRRRVILKIQVRGDEGKKW